MSVSRKSQGRSSKAGQVKPPGKPFKINRIMLLLGGIMLLGLVVRLLPALYCIVGGKVIFLGPDSYYHMRRIVLTVLHYPMANLFDSYVNYPYGFPISWPPLFDVTAATAALLAGFGHPDMFTIEVVASVVPVLMGVAAIALVYYIARDAMNEKVALIAALIMAILPAGVFRSMFSLVDHHELEVLISLAMYLLFMRAVSGARKAGFVGMNHARPVLYAVLAGVATASMILSWDGAPIFIGIIVIYAFVQYAYDALNKEDSGYLTAVGLISSVVAFVIIAPIAYLSVPLLYFNAAELSWFHIIYLLAVALFFLLMGSLSSILRKRGVPWQALPISALVISAIAVLALKLALPISLYGIETGLLYLGGMDKVLSTISEAEPIYLSMGRLSPAVPWAYFSLIGPIAVLGLFLYLYVLKGRRLNNVEVFFLVWTAVVLVLGIMQKRFINLLAVNASIFGGYAFYKVLELAGLEQYLSPADKKKSSASRSGSMSTALLAVILIIPFLLVPALLNSITMAGSPEPYVLDWNMACSWVRDNTPATSFLYSPDLGHIPEYGIMSWWDYGNYILYRAERPARANNFQTGIDDAANFFITGDEAAANAIMDRNKVRYVMLDYRMGSPWGGVKYGIFEDMAYLAGDDPMSYHDIVTSNKTLPANDKYFNCMYSRLFNGDACGGNFSGHAIDPLEHYRLLYVTNGVDPVKVFEYVKGATITGSAEPGSAVELKLKIATPYGQGIYHNDIEAGPDGRYSFIVPYYTSSSSFVKTDAAYSITGGSLSTSVAVPESAVLSGATVQAP